MESQPITNINKDYSKYIHLSRYARYRDDLGRREHYPETVDRYINFMSSHIEDKHGVLKNDPIWDQLRTAILNMEIMPSMRAFMTAGEALRRDNVAGYNCSYLAVDDVRAFDEIMYILMCGTGVGFSVERQEVAKLPSIPDEFHDTDTVIKVKDSKIGWASAYKELIQLLYGGLVPKWDVSKVRLAGERLRTFGGRASGPEPLVDLFKFTIEKFKQAAGRKLNSLEVHDIVCKIADIVVVGGVRRSALISLSNLSDDRMRNAKNGMWWEAEPQRMLANNSVAYTEKPDMETFLKEMVTLYESKSGERGIFNRVAADKQSESTGRRVVEGHNLGTNPCGEILLRSGGFCNLTEVVIRPTDTIIEVRDKVRMATVLGTIQSTLSDFRYLRPKWKRNAEEERLLGVSLTGIMDNEFFATSSDELKEALNGLRQWAVTVNKVWAERLGINQSAAITCIKPSGTVSQLVDSASGIHPRYADYYIRRVRSDNKDPLCKFMVDVGIPNEPEASKPGSVTVFSFPVKSPEGCVLRNDMTAIEQLEHYLIYRKYWCEHNPSITVYYRDHEFPDIIAWIYKHFDEIGGISLLPHSDHVYKQAPYTEITELEYQEFLMKMPPIDWEAMPDEHDDNTTSAKELACIAGVCEL